MTAFLVESYLADSPGALDEARAAARKAADPAAGIRYLRTTFLPRDETVFHLFEARSAESLLAAARRASLPVDRLAEAVEAAGPDRTSAPGPERGTPPDRRSRRATGGP
jgi:hypothetical protein